MDMIAYIQAIQKAFIEQLAFKENAEKPNVPEHVPDGSYRLEIDGRIDNVVITEGKISCCNFDNGVVCWGGDFSHPFIIFLLSFERKIVIICKI